ncbi:hypothetical protein A1D31_16095 [Bradyrhizobium liaoningense]|nr:hypothetical protein A1D31_16095 [Bradyrhizobium liaoningense]
MICFPRFQADVTAFVSEQLLIAAVDRQRRISDGQIVCRRFNQDYDHDPRTRGLARLIVRANDRRLCRIEWKLSGTNRRLSGIDWRLGRVDRRLCQFASSTAGSQQPGYGSIIRPWLRSHHRHRRR